MRRLLLYGLIALSIALLVGYGAAFMLRWGARGLIGAAIFAAALAAAAAAAHGAIPGRAERLVAALAYLLLAGWAALSLLDTFKNDLLRDLLALQLVTAIAGLIVAAWPRGESTRP